MSVQALQSLAASRLDCEPTQLPAGGAGGCGGGGGSGGGAGAGGSGQAPLGGQAPPPGQRTGGEPCGSQGRAVAGGMIATHLVIQAPCVSHRRAVP